MHHVLTRTADHEARVGFGTVEPVLNHGDNAGVGSDQVGQFVNDDGAMPVRPSGVGCQALEEGSPVGVFDVVEAGKPCADGFGQVATLNGRGGLIGNRVEAAVAL